MKAAGGALVAVSIDSPEKTSELLAWLEDDDEGGPLGFPLLSDPTAETIRAFGVYDEEHAIALPAMFVLDRSGAVAWKYVGESIMDRPEEDEVIDAVRAVARGRPASP